MPYATTDDGVRLYIEETGSGRPVIFVHEFAGDVRSFEPQLRHFGKRYRAIAFNARGFPPSDVPEQVSSYSQARAADDILAVLGHIGERQAHISSACRWVVLRRFISAFGIRRARSRSASAVAGTAPSRTSAKNSVPRPM